MTDNLAARERSALADTFLRVGPDAPTLCEGWRTADLAAHLVIRDRRPDLAAGAFVPFLAGRLEDGMQEYAARPWPQLVDLVRTPPAWHPTRVAAVDGAVNLVEMLVHHEDVLRGDVLADGGAPGPRRTVDERLEQAAWTSVRRAARLMWRKCPVNVTLVSPGRGEVTVHPASSGPSQVAVTGAPIELLLFSSGRQSAAAVTVEGPEPAVRAVRTARVGLA